MEVDIHNIVAALFAFAGSFWLFVSALGVLRFPDLYSRMHAATKASSLGIALLLIGASFEFGSWDVWIQCVLVILFVFLTNPISAHLISRAAHKAGYTMCPDTRLDEYEKAKKGG